MLSFDVNKDVYISTG